MAKFRYRMQNILDIKSKMELQAKNEYAFANGVLQDEKEKLRALLGRRAYYEDKLREHLQNEKLDFQDVKDAKIAIRSLDEQLRRQMERVKEAEKVLEQKRLVMMEFMRERKTQEILREKAFQEFIEDEKREESKQIDELTSYVYGVKNATE